MPTLYVTAEEYAALGDEDVRAIEQAGEEVVIVASDAAAEHASWQEVQGGLDAAGTQPAQDDNSVTSSSELTAETEADMLSELRAQYATLRELVALQRETLAATLQLQVSIARAGATPARQGGPAEARSLREILSDTETRRLAEEGALPPRTVLEYARQVQVREQQGARDEVRYKLISEYLEAQELASQFGTGESAEQAIKKILSALDAEIAERMKDTSEPDD